MYSSILPTGSPSRVLVKLCIRINTYEIYSSVLKPAICGLWRANARVEYTKNNKGIKHRQVPGSPEFN